MDELVLQPTPTAQWHALVNEAQLACAIELDEALESYLVFLLMRFTDKPSLLKSMLAVEFLEGLQCEGNLRQDQLRDVGDKCLLYSGLFPGLAKRRRVQLSYFVGLGQSAYSVLSENDIQHFQELFAALSQGFVPLMDVLIKMRSFSGQSPLLKPLEAAELWIATGSQQAYEQLQIQKYNLQ